MKWLFLVVVSVASGAFADIPPANASQCQGASAGAACTTDDGQPGTCVTSMVSRPDYSSGFPPKVKQVPMLLCVASASARAHQLPLARWAGLLALVLLATAGVRVLRSSAGARPPRAVDGERRAESVPSR